jgi:hypothetical protein
VSESVFENQELQSAIIDHFWLMKRNAIGFGTLRVKVGVAA